MENAMGRKLHIQVYLPFPSIFICCSVKEQRQWKECF